MAIGIRCNEVYYFDPPTPAQVLAGLHELTGLSMGMVQPEGYLELFHPEKPAWRIEVDWSQDRLANIQRQRASVPWLPQPPFPDYPHCLRLWLDPRSPPRSYSYLECSLLLVLQELGGQVERPLSLPDWAGKKWTEMPPLGFWQALNERWK